MFQIQINLIPICMRKYICMIQLDVDIWTVWVFSNYISVQYKRLYNVVLDLSWFHFCLSFHHNDWLRTLTIEVFSKVSIYLVSRFFKKYFAKYFCTLHHTNDFSNIGFQYPIQFSRLFNKSLIPLFSLSSVP